MEKEIRILGTSTFGVRLNEEVWEWGLNMNPDVIVAQGTTSDGGPTYLGTDTPYAAFMHIKNDLETIIKSAKEKKIPFILSSGSPSGSNIELERALGAIDEFARKQNIKLKIAVIPGEIDKNYLKQKIKNGAKTRRLVENGSLSEVLTDHDIDNSKRIVSQMGPEPIMKALDLNVNGVITGRALDVGLYMALPLKKGFDKGLAAHMAKSIECSSLVTEPQSFEPIFAILRENYFLVMPINPSLKCTTMSIASHAFYERANPNQEENPGGILDISAVKYEQYDEKTVKVTGSKWITTPYTLKIEGVKQAGYRTICICGIRDEQMIRAIDIFLNDARKYIEKKFHPLKESVDYHIIFRNYGKNGVLGDSEPVKATKSHELGLVIDAVASDESVADAVCATAVDFIVHMDYPGRLTSAANVAFPFSPRELKLGQVYTYNIWHQLEIADPCELFKIEVRTFPTS